MKRVIYTDKSGMLRCVLIRNDDDENYPELGIPIEPPPIERVVREAAQEVQDEFVRRGMLTFQDIVRTQDGVSSVLRDVLRKRIVEAFKLKELEENGQ